MPTTSLLGNDDIGKPKTDKIRIYTFAILSKVLKALHNASKNIFLTLHHILQKFSKRRILLKRKKEGAARKRQIESYFDTTLVQDKKKLNIIVCCPRF